MNTHGWTRIVRLITPVLLATLLSGCQTVPFGAQHPFSTMFQHSEPPQLTEWSLEEPEPTATTVNTEVQSASHSERICH